MIKIMPRKPGMFELFAFLAALATIIVCVNLYADLKAENERLKTEIQSAREKNRVMYDILVKFVSHGNITIGELSPLLSDAEIKNIAERASKEVRVSLPFVLETEFYPSGFMGDGEYGEKYLTLRHENTTIEGNAVTCARIEYRQGPKNWAAIYWQHPDGNWGEKPGLNLTGARKITFYAKGDCGGEIVQFKSGGIRDRKYRDSYSKAIEKTLSNA